MFVVTKAHLSGTKRVVLCNARNETRDAGATQADKASKVALRQARQAKGSLNIEESKQIASMGTRK